MSSLFPSAEPTFTTTLLFNDAAAAAAVTISAQSPIQSTQGTILLHQSPNCSVPLSDNATPLILGDCLNMPFSGIGSVSISSLPTCPDNGTPLLIVSDLADCKVSTSGSGADSGERQKCLDYGGKDLGSMGFTCYGDGLVSVTSAAAAGLMGTGYSRALAAIFFVSVLLEIVC